MAGVASSTFLSDLDQRCVASWSRLDPALTAGQNKPLTDEAPQKQYIIDVLLHVASGSSSANKGKKSSSLANGIRPAQPGETGEYSVIPVLLSTLDGISHIRIFLPKDLKPAEARAASFKNVVEVQRRFPDGIALLDPIVNMGIADDEFKQLIKVRSAPSFWEF